MDTLRPLGFGELFDRAITLYVRNFWAFVGIALLDALPMTIFSWYFNSRELSPASRLLAGIFHIAPAASVPLVSAHPVMSADILILVPLVVVDSIVYAAICIGVRAARQGEPFAALGCLKRALQVWRPVMRLAVASVALAVGLFVGGALIAAVVTAIVAGLFVMLGGSDFASGLRAGPVVATALLLVLGACWVSMWNFALYDVVLEGSRVRKALGANARRLFSQRLFLRIVAILVCALIIGFVAQACFLIPAGLAQLTGALWANVTLTVVGDVVVLPFGVIVMVLAYYDVRVRREGLDILQRIKPDMTVEHA